jgi:hypothetical protein
MSFAQYVKHELSLLPEPRETTPEAVLRHKRKRQLVYNFFQVPLALETFMCVGVTLCMECLLSLFFDLPLRLLLAVRSAVQDGPAAIQPGTPGIQNASQPGHTTFGTHHRHLQRGWSTQSAS